jgi:peptide/nickel transport system ATP-binding protein
LLTAVPVPDPDALKQRAVLGGDVPSPVNPPKGCHFHTRCPKVFERCRHETPPLRPLSPDRSTACHLYDAPAGAIAA